MKYKRLIFAYVLVLSIPGLLTMINPGLSGNSRIELRDLHDLPGVPRSVRDFLALPQEFDQFTTDRFPFREKIINIASGLFYKMGISISPEVLIGADGWLFLRREEDVLDESRGIISLSEEQVGTWADEYNRRKTELENRGIKLILAVAPNKHTIYPQYMPPWNFPVGPTIADQIYSELKSRGIAGVVDLRELLREKSRSELVYQRHNTHWNDLGAFYAYESIIRYIPEAYRIQFEDLEFEDQQVTGDLALLMGNANLTETSKVLNIDASGLTVAFDSEQNIRDFFNKGWLTTRSGHHDRPRALLICDSYTRSFLYKYLAPSFSVSLFRHRSGVEFNSPTVQQFDPDYVVYIVAERSLPHELGDRW